MPVFEYNSTFWWALCKAYNVRFSNIKLSFITPTVGNDAWNDARVSDAWNDARVSDKTSYCRISHNSEAARVAVEMILSI